MAFAKGTIQKQGKQPHKYNGKELDQMHGLNLYDYSARYYEPAIGRFTTVDPLAEMYYSISPYAYCNNNPIKYVDLKGDSLTLVGNQSDIQATVDIHNANVGPYSNVTVNSSGLVSKTSIYAQYGEQVAGMMDAAAQVLMTPEQRAYAKTLDKIINDTKMTTINVENGTAVFIGDIDKAIIDMGDISNLPASNSPITRASALIHETDEQYRVQVKNISNWPAHKQATRTESLQVGYQMDPIREHVTVGNEGIMHVRSADGRHNAIVHTRNNNIVKVVSW